MVVVRTKVTEEEAQRRAQQKAIQAELDVMAKEERQRQELDQAVEFKRQQAQRAADDVAVADLRELKTLYDARQQAFDRLEDAFKEFRAVDGQIRPKLTGIYNRSGMQFLHQTERAQHIIQLRQRAGLTQYHDMLDAGRDQAGDIALTMVLGYLRGFVGQGWVTDGNSRKPVTLSRPE